MHRKRCVRSVGCGAVRVLNGIGLPVRGYDSRSLRSVHRPQGPARGACEHLSPRQETTRAMQLVWKPPINAHFRPTPNMIDPAPHPYVLEFRSVCRHAPQSGAKPRLGRVMRHLSISLFEAEFDRGVGFVYTRLPDLPAFGPNLHVGFRLDRPPQGSTSRFFLFCRFLGEFTDFASFLSAGSATMRP